MNWKAFFKVDMNSDDDKTFMHNYLISDVRDEVNEYMNIIDKYRLIAENISEMNIITSFDIISFEFTIKLMNIDLQNIKSYLENNIDRRPINVFGEKYDDLEMCLVIEIPKSVRDLLSYQDFLENCSIPDEGIHFSLGCNTELINTFFPLSDNAFGVITGLNDSGKTSLLNLIMISIMRWNTSNMILFRLFVGQEARPRDKIFYQHAKFLSKKNNYINELLDELNNRYQLLLEAECRNFDEYNEKMLESKSNPLPAIYTIIDDYNNTNDRELMVLTLKGRTVGMYTIISIRAGNNMYCKPLFSNVNYEISFNKNTLRYNDFIYDSARERIRFKLPEISEEELEKACKDIIEYI